MYILLCDDDKGKNGGKGTVVMRAAFEDCILMENTTLHDKNGAEIFEGDIVRVCAGQKTFEGKVPDVPDLFRSRKVHPLTALFKENGFSAVPEDIEIELLGNIYEKKR
jgi:uncharacterized phage protein (TIGR01671 family)